METLAGMRFLGGPLLAVACAGAFAQEAYPNRPIRLVVPFGAGGSADLVARVIGESMQADLGQPVVIENRPGAGGTVGTGMVAKNPPDGYTVLLAGTPNFAINQYLYGPAMSGNLNTDFIPVSMAVSSPNIIVTNSNFPAANLRELIDAAKRQPGKIFVTTGSVGSSGHLAGALLAHTAGVDWTYVPDKNPIVPLLSGAVQAGIYTVPATLPLIRAGKLKALAVTSAERSVSAPDIPTVAESGYPGFEATAWYGFAVATGTPQSIVHRLEDATRKATQKPQVRAKLEQMGNDVTFLNEEQFDRFVHKEREKWAEMVKLTGAKPD